MDEAIQPDAPDDLPPDAKPKRTDRTAAARKRAWRKANPAKAAAAAQRWRARHGTHWRAYMRRYMKQRRAAARARLTDDDM